MITIIEVPLRTREVYTLFERKLKGERLFLEVIQHKINRLIGKSKEQDENATFTINQFKEKMTGLTAHFITETTRFEQLLNKKKVLQGKTIQFVIKFRPTLVIYNSLSLSLVQFLESYDNLIATIKLLRLADCFCSEMDYFHTKSIYQKMANQLLSSMIVTSIKFAGKKEQLHLLSH
ncbi:MAG: hypothetical protein H0U70_07545 [Tatlockia sp.]|nr:hypothetical protein [Tatlockia sp.]